MTERHPWEELDTDLPEPGSVEDHDHGLPGPEEPLPSDDAGSEEPTAVNDPEEEEDDD